MSDWVLHVRSWNQPDSVHFYGRIEDQDHDWPDVRIERTLTAEQASELERQERAVAKYRMFADDREEQARVTYKAGDTTERFTDRAELVEAAKVEFLRHARRGEALYEHMAWLRGEEPLVVAP